jgi:hypothetical protein
MSRLSPCPLVHPPNDSKYIFVLVGVLFSCTMSSSVTFAQTPNNYPAEAFIASGLNNRMFHDTAFMYRFQRAFRSDSHKVAPALDIKSGSAGPCRSVVTVQIASEDVSKKWDGTIDPNGLSATSLFIDLRYAQQNLTEIKYLNGRPTVTMYFVTTGSDILFFDIGFQYGGSTKWESARYYDPDFSLKGGPFRFLFEEVAMNLEEFYKRFGFSGRLFSTWLALEEVQRDVAVRYLKDIFSKCRL